MTSRYAEASNMNQIFGGDLPPMADDFALRQQSSAAKATRQRQNSGASMKDVFSWSNPDAVGNQKVDPASLKAAGVRGRPANSTAANVNFFSGEANAKFNYGDNTPGKRTIAEFPLNQASALGGKQAPQRRTHSNARDATFNFFTGEAK